MITNEQNTALLNIAYLARKNTAWQAYAQYCTMREQGLRKQSLAQLNEFIKQSTAWTYDEKVDFVKFLFPLIESSPDVTDGAMPHPLSKQLLQPTLQAWCSTEERDSAPFRWLGTYYRDMDSLVKAIALNPADDIARAKLVDRKMDVLYYSIHHMPEGYLGNPEEDLVHAEVIRALINGFVNQDKRSFWLRDLEDDLELIRNYIAWKKSGHANLKLWGDENNKLVTYGIGRVYYYSK